MKRQMPYLVLLLVLAACSIDQSLSPLRRQSDSMDCTANPETCSAILGAINFLQSSNLVECRNYGNSLLDRYNAPAGVAGFEDGDIENANAYVDMTPDNTTSSGYRAIDGYIHVVSYNFLNEDTQHEAGTLSHEEVHSEGEDGPYHNTGYAAAAAHDCGGD